MANSNRVILQNILEVVLKESFTIDFSSLQKYQDFSGGIQKAIDILGEEDVLENIESEVVFTDV